MKSVIWWVRRDLRLSDNEALFSALETAEQVVPVFVIDNGLLRSPYNSQRRLNFLLHGLRKLDGDLRARGGRLVLRRGVPVVELEKLVRESGAGAIFAEADHSPYARQRDEAASAKLPLELIAGVSVHPPGTVLKPDGSPYTVFTPFSRAWKALPWPGSPRPAPERVLVPEEITSLSLEEMKDLFEEDRFPAGEAEGQQRLKAFRHEQIYWYGERRNRLDLDGTSALSPYLRFGMISARQAAHAARTALEEAETSSARKSAETWLSELIWREFYIHILHHFPHVRGTAFRTHMADIQWENNEEAFLAWKEGRTGYPVVDAGMRQLSALGWMHNRARMITASFLVKDLLIDWRWGEQYFMQMLLDGDPAANNGGWQWTAGTGTDAAPYFRVFNPVLQGKKFDPQGEYVRRFVPELANVPDEYIHEPWKMNGEMQKQVGCTIGVDYPLPMVDHAEARLRALARYGEPGD
jgi:deoxyribodipyrimidine photo-lyase